MGLSQLLAASRTVRNIKNQPSRFKMTQQNLLPKFGADKADGAPAADEASGVVELVAEPALPAQPVANPAVAVEQGGLDRVEPGLAKAVAVADAVKKLRPFGNWSLFKNPFRKAEPRQIEARPAQAELSLDLVKPVRNDLSEVDFELGRMPPQADSQPRTPTEPIAVPAVSVAGKSSGGGGRWRRIKIRLFRARDKN